MPSAKELREKRTAEIVPDLYALRDRANDDKQEWRAEDEAAWEKVNADYDDLTHQIEEAERVDSINERAKAIEAHQEAPAGDLAVGRDNITLETAQRRNGGGPASDEDRALALQSWARAGDPCGDLTDRHREACQRLNYNPYRRGLLVPLVGTDQANRAARAWRMSPDGMAEARALAALAERRDLSAITGSAGAFTFSSDFVNQLEINMLAFGGMLQVADILRTATGNPVEWPTADDTSNTGEQLGESTSVGSSVDPSFAQVVFYAYKFHAKLIKVPNELLQDSAFNLVAVISAMLGERLGRITNTRATTGTGAGTFKGIVTAATLGKTTASGTVITPDEVLDLIHSVDPAYRIGARFMFHDNVLLHLRKKKAGDGNYIWQDGLAGAPSTLWAYPYTINQDMSSTITSTDKTMLFGQLNKYKIRQVSTVRLIRLDERYADLDQVAFDAFMRQDGNLIDAGTAPVEYMQQA